MWRTLWPIVSARQPLQPPLPPHADGDRERPLPEEASRRAVPVVFGSPRASENPFEQSEARRYNDVKSKGYDIGDTG